MHRHAMRLEHAHELVRNLDPDALLDGEAAREDADQARELGDADDLLVRDVPDIRVAVEWQGVVLAEGIELDRPLDDLADSAVGPAMAFGRKRGQQLGVALIAGGGFIERAQVPLRRVPRARRVPGPT